MMLGVYLTPDCSGPPMALLPVAPKLNRHLRILGYRFDWAAPRTECDGETVYSLRPLDISI